MTDDDALMEVIHTIVADDRDSGGSTARVPSGCRARQGRTGGHDNAPTRPTTSSARSTTTCTEVTLPCILQRPLTGSPPSGSCWTSGPMSRLATDARPNRCTTRSTASPGELVVERARSQEATVRRLLDAGADPNTFDGNGTSPLHRAIRESRVGRRPRPAGSGRRSDPPQWEGLDPPRARHLDHRQERQRLDQGTPRAAEDPCHARKHIVVRAEPLPSALLRPCTYLP